MVVTAMYLLKIHTPLVVDCMQMGGDQGTYAEYEPAKHCYDDKIAVLVFMHSCSASHPPSYEHLALVGALKRSICCVGKPSMQMPPLVLRY